METAATGPEPFRTLFLIAPSPANRPESGQPARVRPAGIDVRAPPWPGPAVALSRHVQATPLRPVLARRTPAAPGGLTIDAGLIGMIAGLAGPIGVASLIGMIAGLAGPIGVATRSA